MTDHAALLRPDLPPTIERLTVIVAPGSSWTPPGGTEALILVLAGRVTIYDDTGAATFGPVSLLPATSATPLTLHNASRVPAALTTFTRTAQEH